MERPAKRSRIGAASYDNDDADDELFLEPDEINARRDPAVQLDNSRAKAAYKLKSRFEAIFEKYEKDFTDVGDEIDIGTGEVVVDNGHIRSLFDAEDARSVAPSEDTSDEEERILHGKASGQLVRTTPGSVMPHPSYGGRLSGLGSLMLGPPRLSAMFSGLELPNNPALGGTFGSFLPVRSPAESAWSAPELPRGAFDRQFALQTQVTTRRVAVRSLAAPIDDSSDEDDIIMGSATPFVPAKEKSSKPESKDSTKKMRSQSPKIWGPLSPVSDGETRPPVEVALVEDLVPGASLGTEPAVDLAEATPHTAKTELDREPPLPKQNRSEQPARKRGRPRKYEARVQKSHREPPEVSTMTFNHVDKSILADSDARDAETPNKPQNSRGHLVVLLVRRRRPEAMTPSHTESETDAEPPLPAGQPLREKEQPELPGQTSPPTPSGSSSEHIITPVPVPNMKRFAQRQISSLPFASTSEKRRNDTEKQKTTRRTLPASSPLTQLGSPVKESSAKKSTAKNSPASQSTVKGTSTNACQADDMAVSSQDQPAPRAVSPDILPAMQPPMLPPTAHMEQFARNVIDTAYDFSDEDEPFIRRTATEVAEPKKTSVSNLGRSMVKRVSKAPISASKSSPSIRAAYPMVKKSSRNTEKSEEEILHGPRPALEQTLPSKVCKSPSKPISEVGHVVKKRKHSETSSRSQGSALSSVADSHGTKWTHPEISRRVHELPSSSPGGPQDQIRRGPSPRVLELSSSPLRPSHKPTQQNPLPITPAHQIKNSITTMSTTRLSSSKHSIISLIPDDDEDELSLSLDQISPLSRSRALGQQLVLINRIRPAAASAPRRASLLGSYAKAKSRQRLSDWTPLSGRASLRGGGGRSRGGIGSSPIGTDLHRTPGGTMRRCGENGFRCERDFCFACL